MKKKLGLTSRLKNQRGAVAVIVAILLAVFIGFTALVVDVGHLYVVGNELQNGSDAGALAGARWLYTADGTAVNPGANQIAYDAAVSNVSDGSYVEVKADLDANGGDVQRGHWTLATHTFTPNDSLTAVNIIGVSAEDLDADPNFINAVKVVSRREDTPAASYFARIFGYQSFIRQAQAIAYIGFAGSIQPLGLNQPIAICEESILNNLNQYDCSMGRMINSGQNASTSNSGGWTSLSQANADGSNDPCQGGTSASEVRPLVCAEGNPKAVQYGKGMAMIGGQVQSAFDDFWDCWDSHVQSTVGEEQKWSMMLPVIECPGNNVDICAPMIGAVTVEVIWVNTSISTPTAWDAEGNVISSATDWGIVPLTHGGWTAPAGSEDNGEERWESFVSDPTDPESSYFGVAPESGGGFNLRNVTGDMAPFQKKAIYFAPSCKKHIPTGMTGGGNFGVLAKTPVLVH
jgi:Flp pilus assembly protein TadG